MKKLQGEPPPLRRAAARRKMRYIIHADDYGLTRGITDSILDAADNGALTSVSVCANGGAFEYAMEEYRRREGRLRLAVHLNLCEGSPVLPAGEAGMLTGEDGAFNLGFAGLWGRYLMSGRKAREALRREVRAELAAQITKVKRAAGPGWPVSLDSHRYYHMIPFVFDVLIDMKEELGIEYIRTTREPLVLSLKGLTAMRSAVAANLVKRSILNSLSKTQMKALASRGISTCDWFVGVLYSGHMTEAAVVAAHKKLEKLGDDARTAELLFHPGRPGEDERANWGGNKEFLGFYYSPMRRAEAEALKSERVRGLFG